MTITEQYGLAFQIVDKLFANKLDKGGQPYLGHLCRVSDSLTKRGKFCSEIPNIYDKAAVVALLHDILEDTDTTIDTLRVFGFDEDIIQAVDVISRREDEQYYFDFIKRVSKNRLATLVKICDLKDNMDITRLNKFGEYEQKRLMKYWYSWKFLTGEFTEEQCNKIKNMK